MGYFGSKATSGLCQALIALMPPHSVYIESHLGGGALMKRKPTGVRSIGIDRDAQALEAFALPAGSRVERNALTPLRGTRSETGGANCQCQVVDINDKNKLKLPREWVERVLARQ